MKKCLKTGRKIFLPSLLLCCLLLSMATMAFAVETVQDQDIPNVPPLIDLDIVDPLTPYTSTRLYEDVQLLADRNPGIVSLSSIGQSALGKDIPLITLGTGKRPVLWIGALHAREVVTSAYLMLTTEMYARAYAENSAFGDTPAEKVQWLLDEFTVYIVPMANPDGVDIVTDGGSANVNVDNAKTWKNNANGVNLNRNFPFDWDANRTDIGYNYAYYKGPSAGSEPETQALIALCESVAFEHMVSCHVQGKIQYWRDNHNGVVPGDEALARKIFQIMGYTMMPSTSKGNDGWSGGFENWFRYRFNRPGICLEFARHNTTDYETMAKFYTSDMVDWPKSQNLIFGVLDGLSNLTAKPTASTVYVNGEPVAFDAYYINGNNYFKLRDIAYILTGTEKQFEVEWDAETNDILLTDGLPYTPVGGEMTGKGPDEQKPAPTKSVILLNGQRVNLKACLIRGNNYFKLRDIGKLFDFEVSWYGDDNAIRIETGAAYTDD